MLVKGMLHSVISIYCSRWWLLFWIWGAERLLHFLGGKMFYDSESAGMV